MKFLPREKVSPNIIPLNFIYNRGDNFGEDVLTIIFKDNKSGIKSVHSIKNPKIEIYIVKPEYRTFDEQRSLHWYPIEKCDVHKVPYATRYHEASKILNLQNSDAAKVSPYIYGADIEIENYYLIQFIKEYPTSGHKNITTGFLDIENDIIRLNRFPEYGETPINAVTYIDGENQWAHTFILAKHNLPVLSKEHPKYAEMEGYRESFTEQLNYVKEHKEELIKEFHDDFDSSYGEFQYTLTFFDDEITLMRTLWEIIKEINNDYVEVWNLPYDMQNLMIRPGVLGYDVNEIIPDEKILEGNPSAKLLFKEDKNPKAHKRKHQCVTLTMPTFLDDMVIYAGIRSGRGELASTKLNYVAQLELQDEKLNYEEDGDIRTLFYRNLRKFIKYNLKDVLLQYGIETKTKDIQTIYSRVYDLFVTPSQSFTTTKVILHALYSFALSKGYMLGQNRNKGQKDSIPVNYSKVFNAMEDNVDEDDYFDMLFGDTNIDDDDDPDDDSDKPKKREKYDGAFVMNPLYASPTGVKIRGKDTKYVHDDVADADVTSEYPSAIIIGNISSETLVGRVFLEGDLPKIPIPSAFEFRGDEEAKYKLDVSNFMLECYSERDYITFGNLFLGLPSFSELVNMIEKGEL